MSGYGQIGDYGYADLLDIGAKILELPYSDPKIAMYVILPNSKDGRHYERNYLSITVQWYCNNGLKEVTPSIN